MIHNDDNKNNNVKVSEELHKDEKLTKHGNKGNFHKLQVISEMLVNLDLNLHDSINIKEIKLFETFRDSLYYKNEFIDQDLSLLKEITAILIKKFYSTKPSSHQSQSLLEIVEKCFYLFLFHYHIEILNLAYTILNIFLLELEYNFHKETLQKLIKILHVLKVKKTVNAPVCNKVISNISNSIVLIINYTNTEVRKIFLDFIIKNSVDYVLIYFLCASCDNSLNYRKCYTAGTESSIITLIEKSSRELEKLIKAVESALQNFKQEKSASVEYKIKQSIDYFAFVSKLIDSFNPDSKTYNYDKILKNILIPLLKKFWNLIVFTQDSEFYVSFAFIYLGYRIFY